jgi:molybdopterin synthase catalytic subunit
VRIRVLFFGILKDIVGQSQDELEIPSGGVLQLVFDHYASRFPRLKDMSSSIVLAKNQQFAPASTPVSDGDEVAFLPPVSGGGGVYTHEIADPRGHFFALTRDPIDSAAVGRSLLAGEDGALITFEGVVRNNTKGRATKFLDYECYEEMAVKMMAQIGLEIAAALPISRIAMVHRLGRLQIGEASVAIIVTAPHRKPAFEAALEGINRLKRTVPIWKKEYFVDGEVWVEGEWDTALPRSTGA